MTMKRAPFLITPPPHALATDNFRTMWPATAWDDKDWDGNQARGWTVMDGLRGKQKARLAARRRARNSSRTSLPPDVLGYLVGTSVSGDYERRLAASWTGEWSVLAFLFATPSQAVFRGLDQDGDYFDHRTGDTWDLFFPGYFRSSNADLERNVGSRPLRGQDFASDWWFNARDFNALREHVEEKSGDRWRFSGDTDLVLAAVYIPDSGGPTIDWETTQSGTMGPGDSLGSIIESITRDLVDGNEDPAYGVGHITQPERPNASNEAAKKVMVAALSGIASAAGKAIVGN